MTIAADTDEVVFELERVLPWREKGWVTADTHVHFPSPSTGPAVAAGIFSDIWVYIVATIVGGVLAGVLYRYYLEEA